MQKATRNIVSVLLAAGRGRRMGQPKALLRWQGRSFCEHLIRAHYEAGVTHVVVVTLPLVKEALAKEIECPVTWVQGLDQEEPIDSLLRAVAVLDNAPDAALLVGPVDQGPIPVSLLTTLCQQFPVDACRVRIPTYQTQQGHPVLIGAGFRPLLRKHEGGLRGLFQEHPQSIEYRDVKTRATLRNLNTPEQFEAFQRAAEPIHF